MQAIQLKCLLLPIKKVRPHPLNPRPWSDEFQARVSEEKAEEIAKSIISTGYDSTEAILVRPKDDGWEILRGHNRWAGALKAGLTEIPAFVREDVDDKEAAMMLCLAQGKEIDEWAQRRHIYECTTPRGDTESGLLSQREYAELANKAEGTINRQIVEYRVYLRLTQGSLPQGGLSEITTRFARDIASLDEEDQEWAASTLLSRKPAPNLEERCRAIKAVKAIQIPELFQEWLPPLKWKKAALVNAILFTDPRDARDVSRWIVVAQEQYNLFQEDDVMYRLEKGRHTPYTIKPREMFLAELKQMDGHPSDPKILAAADRIRKAIERSKQAYQDWLASQQTAIDRVKEEEKLAEIRLEYSPVGFLGDIRFVHEQIIQAYPDGFDAVITDPPYLLSNGGSTVRSGREVSVDKNFEDERGVAIEPEQWIPIASKMLKRGGWLAFTCTDHLLFNMGLRVGDVLEAGESSAFKLTLSSFIESCGLNYFQTLIWHKNAPPLLTADRFQQNYEFIVVARKPGANSYFGYNELKKGNSDRQIGSVLYVPQCAGAERVGWNDTQKPLALADTLIKAFVPVDGLFLDPFAGSGTFSVSGKKMQRKSVWVEKDEGQFQLTQSRIDTSPFHF